MTTSHLTIVSLLVILAETLCPEWNTWEQASHVLLLHLHQNHLLPFLLCVTFLYENKAWLMSWFSDTIDSWFLIGCQFNLCSTSGLSHKDVLTPTIPWQHRCFSYLEVTWCHTHTHTMRLSVRSQTLVVLWRPQVAPPGREWVFFTRRKHTHTHTQRLISDREYIH